MANEIILSADKTRQLLHISKRKCAWMLKKGWPFLPKYFTSRNGTDVAQVIKEFTFLRQEYTVDGLGWSVKGNLWAHKHEIICNGRTVATVSKIAMFVQNNSAGPYGTGRISKGQQEYVPILFLKVFYELIRISFALFY